MKPELFFLTAVIFILSACGSNSGNNNTQNTEENNSEETQSVQQDEKAESSADKQQSSKPQSSGFWEKLEMKSIRDSRGVETAQMPIPSTWKMHSGGQGSPTFTGPNGLKITDYPLQSFTYVTDPYTQQLYMQSGMNLRPMPGVEQVIEQDLKPWCANRGYTFVRHYEATEVTKMDKWYSDQLYKAMPTQSEIAAIGTEWVNQNGEPYFVLMHLNVQSGNGMQNWYYYCTDIVVEKSSFEKAKKQLLFTLANTRYALEPIAEYNRREAEKAGQSWAAHNQRMAQNQANFEAQQRNFINKSNAINDAIMNGWRAQNEASDKAHEQFVDVITERTNVANTETGQQYKVESGYNNYWMNANGEYISTDQYNYNPNLDDNMNNENWQKLKEVKR